MFEKNPILGNKVKYTKLNPRQKEIYNFQKASAIFAEYGWTTIKLSDDWMGADFIAIKFGGKKYLKVQLKGRLTFQENYQRQDLYICFFDRKKDEIKNVYLYPHDEVLKKIIKRIKKTYNMHGGYSYSGLSKDNKEIMQPYLFG